MHKKFDSRNTNFLSMSCLKCSPHPGRQLENPLLVNSEGFSFSHSNTVCLYSESKIHKYNFNNFLRRKEPIDTPDPGGHGFFKQRPWINWLFDMLFVLLAGWQAWVQSLKTLVTDHNESSTISHMANSKRVTCLLMRPAFSKVKNRAFCDYGETHRVGGSTVIQ